MRHVFHSETAQLWLVGSGEQPALFPLLRHLNVNPSEPGKVTRSFWVRSQAYTRGSPSSVTGRKAPASLTSGTMNPGQDPEVALKARHESGLRRPHIAPHPVGSVHEQAFPGRGVSYLPDALAKNSRRKDGVGLSSHHALGSRVGLAHFRMPESPTLRCSLQVQTD